MEGWDRRQKGKGGIPGKKLLRGEEGARGWDKLRKFEFRFIFYYSRYIYGPIQADHRAAGVWNMLSSEACSSLIISGTGTPFSL
jgi:hypothetical protein